MPRFYFDVREGSRFAPDDEGFEVADLDAAEHEAALAAAGIGRELLPKGGGREVTVEVRDEQGQHVTTVKVTMQIERVPPEAPASHAREPSA